MPTEAEIIQFLREMKGARLAVLIACQQSGAYLENVELRRWTGYNQDTVRNAVRSLVDEGWLQADGWQGPWRLAPGRQLPISVASVPAQPAPQPGQAASRSSSKKQQMEQKFRAWLAQASRGEQLRALQVLEVLHRGEVMDPKAWELAMQPHITPEYAFDHLVAAHQQGHKPGTAIDRMSKGWEPPILYSPRPDDDES